MCGIHGIIKASPWDEGQKKYNSIYERGEKEFIRDGFVAGSLRGMDSSGMMQLDNKLQSYVHKLPVMGPIFIEDKISKQFLDDVQRSPVTLCHVRHATQGKLTLNNAHPFQIVRPDGSELVGVHNGTITNWKYKAGKHADNYAVDSEWALARIAADGADAFEDFDVGSYSFVWWDEKNPTRILFARNKERPMYFLRSEDKKAILFGSEPGMLWWLAERNGIKVADKIYQTDVGKMYSIDFNDKELTWKDLGFLPVKKPAASAGHVTGCADRCDVTGMYEGDDDWGDRTWNAQLGRYEYNRSGTAFMSEWDRQRRVAIIRDVNEALRKARDKRMGITALDAVLEDDAQKNLLEQAAEAGLIQDREDLDNLPFRLDSTTTTDTDDDDQSAIMEYNYANGRFVQVADSSWFDTVGASEEEIADAKKQHWFGELVVVEPMVWDATQRAMLCDVADDMTDEEVKFTGIIRGYSEIEFDATFEGRQIHAAIIGSGKDENGFTQFFLCPINTKGEEALMRMAS